MKDLANCNSSEIIICAARGCTHGRRYNKNDSGILRYDVVTVKFACVIQFKMTEHIATLFKRMVLVNNRTTEFSIYRFHTSPFPDLLVGEYS